MGLFFFFLPPPQPSQSRWESLQSIMWIYLSWLIGIFTFEKLATGWIHQPVLSWVGPMSLDGLGQLGSSSSLGVVLLASGTGGGHLPYSCLGTYSSEDLSSNLWRAFSPKWLVACKELTNFHWRFPGRKMSPSFWNHPIWSSWKPSLLEARVKEEQAPGGRQEGSWVKNLTRRYSEAWILHQHYLISEDPLIRHS